MSIERQNNEHHLLFSTMNQCKSKPGSCFAVHLNISEIYVLFRVSKCFRYLKDSREPHSTLDIVQFGWIPCLFEDAPLTQKPKNVFRNHLEDIKYWCKENNLALFIENIMSEKLYHHYSTLGFKETNQETSLLLPYHDLRTTNDRPSF